MFPLVSTLGRRTFLVAAGSLVGAPLLAAADATGGDPFGSLQWPGLRREFFGAAPLRFDERVQVKGPGFAVDPMTVPVTVSVDGLADVEQIVVIVDRNPIRKVLEFEPLAGARPTLSFRFKLEQASPVRAAARTKDGVWHVGGTLVDSAGGGCTVPGSTRADGSWSRTLGQVSGRVFDALDGPGGARVRLRVMHPMDTGLVAGIPAFYLKRLSLSDAGGAELLRLATYEPISENPVFSFDFARRPAGPLRVSGSDNNGNRVDGQL
ncbi:MAG TPA: quinoprotein dehydrogenase-associated SoxYZ-like carrier [Methylibium sp.]|nr:quinoprotein dehydrogenase-associated SoxYZ-like carrier [Methylibium sp.]